MYLLRRRSDSSLGLRYQILLRHTVLSLFFPATSIEVLQFFLALIARAIPRMYNRSASKSSRSKIVSNTLSSWHHSLPFFPRVRANGHVERTSRSFSFSQNIEPGHRIFDFEIAIPVKKS